MKQYSTWKNNLKVYPELLLPSWKKQTTRFCKSVAKILKINYIPYYSVERTKNKEGQNFFLSIIHKEVPNSLNSESFL